jgi:hypothetical protein
MSPLVWKLFLFCCLVGSDSQAAKQQEYEFVPSTAKTAERYDFYYGDYQVVGYINEKGGIFLDLSITPFFWGEKNGMRAAHNPSHTQLTDRFKVGQRVYEFRSRRLVPGTLDKELNFVPDLDGKIIRFEDYHYDPKGPQIYNLPGRFVPRSTVKKER